MSFRRGFVLQPCRGGLALSLSCSFCACLRTAHSAVDSFESYHRSKPSDLQEFGGTANLRVAENAHVSTNRVVMDGENLRKHEPKPSAVRNSCTRDEALPSLAQCNVDAKIDTRLLESSAVGINVAHAGNRVSQNGLPTASKDDHLASYNSSVVERVTETEYVERDAESSIGGKDGDENAEPPLHLGDASRISRRMEFPPDEKMVEDICDVLEKEGWESSVEASLNKHFVLQLSHVVVAKVILKLTRLALAKPFFEWACRHLGLDLYSCHALLLKLGENKTFDEMWELLDRLRDNNQQMTETTFCIIVKAYGAACLPDMAVAVITRLNDYGVTAGNHVFSTLLSVFFKLRLLHDARLCYRKLLVDIVKLDATLYSTLIRGFGIMGYSGDAQACFDAMLREGFEPDLPTFNGLIEGFCCNGAMQKAMSTFLGLQKKGLKPSVFTFNVLMKAFCRAGRLEEAIVLFQEMGCLPNQATFNTFLRGLLSNAEAAKAISFFELMEREGWVDPRSYVLLSSGLQDMEKTEEMLKLLWRLFDVHGFANRDLCNALIYNLSQLGQLDEAEKLFKGVASVLESPNVSTQAIMISAYCRAEKLNEALALITELKERGFQPNAYCYVPIISLMLKCNRVVDALKWVEEMLKLHLEVTPITYERLLKQLCKQGLVEQAVKIGDLVVDKNIGISVDTSFKLMKCVCKLQGAGAANARFRTMYRQKVVPKTNAVLQALAVMDTMVPMLDEE